VELDVQDGGNVNLAVEPAGHLELPVDRLTSGNLLEDRELRRRIDARRFPTIAGDLRAMQPVDEQRVDGQYLVSGDLTFRGVTRSHTDRMTIEALDDGTIQLSGRTTFDIRDFGMQPPRILMLKVLPDVGVRVEIVAELAKRAAPEKKGK
jgi:polyisoprenoid-binding protein YceI